MLISIIIESIMKMQKTHSFVLFEVLLALLLITMSILPFSSYPYRVYKKEIILLEKMTMEPLFPTSFEEAYANKENPQLEPIELLFGEKNSLKISRLATITTKTEEKYRKDLTTVEITLSSPHTKITREKHYVDRKK